MSYFYVNIQQFEKPMETTLTNITNTTKPTSAGKEKHHAKEAKEVKGGKDGNRKKSMTQVMEPSAEELEAIRLKAEKEVARKKKEEERKKRGGVEYIEGYVYDIGPATIRLIEEELMGTDLLLVWGCVGVCEVSLFQGGQRAVVTSAVHKKRFSGAEQSNLDNNGVVTVSNPMHTLLIGDSTVEWFSRFLDPDGESGGDLVGTGRVSYATRDSRVAVGFLGLLSSNVLETNLLLRRLSRPAVFLYENEKAMMEGIGLFSKRKIRDWQRSQNEWVFNNLCNDDEDEEDDEEE